MQARFVTTLFASSALVALGLCAVATAAETEHDKHVFVNNFECAEGQAIHVSGASGGVWKTTNGAAGPAAPSSVTTAPAEARFDAFIAIGGVDGESTDDPHRDLPAEEAPAATCPTVESGQPQESDALSYNFSGIDGAAAPSAPAASDVQSQQDPQALIGMLVPAVQKVRSAASRAGHPQMDGVVVLNQEEEQTAGTGTLTLTNGGQAVVPEMPICAHCSSDVEAQAQQTEPQAERRERPRRNFSLTIGGVTVGTGGVNVAVGDVTGDGRGESRSRPPARAPAAGSR